MSLIETVPVHVLLPSLHVSSRASFPFLLAVAERLASDAKDEALALVRLVILADASREGGIRGGVLSPGTVGFWPGACEKPTSPTGDVDHASPLPRAPAWLLPQQSSARVESAAHALPAPAKSLSPPTAIWVALARPCTSTGVSHLSQA